MSKKIESMEELQRYIELTDDFANQVIEAEVEDLGVWSIPRKKVTVAFITKQGWTEEAIKKEPMGFRPTE